MNKNLTQLIEEGQKEFDVRFTREDGLIDKYAYNDEFDLVATPDVIKSFLATFAKTLVAEIEKGVVPERIDDEEAMRDSEERELETKILGAAAARNGWNSERNGHNRCRSAILEWFEKFKSNQPQ